MSNTQKLKIFYGAALIIGETIAGFSVDSMEDPFTDSTFVVTSSIDSIVAHAGGSEKITAGGKTFEIERVQRPVWMVLMAKLDAYRQSLESFDA